MEEIVLVPSTKEIQTKLTANTEDTCLITVWNNRRNRWETPTRRAQNKAPRKALLLGCKTDAAPVLLIWSTLCRQILAESVWSNDQPGDHDFTTLELQPLEIGWRLTNSFGECVDFVHDYRRAAHSHQIYLLEKKILETQQFSPYNDKLPEFMAVVYIGIEQGLWKLALQ